MSENGYLDFLEAQFAQGVDAEKAVGPIDVSLISEFVREYVGERTVNDTRAGYNRASLWVSPTSSLGPAFGLTQNDIDRSVRRLAEGRALPYGDEVLKRILDVVLVAISMVLLAPVFLVIALSIKAESRGPVFYRQRRVGRAGRTFRMLKFRTMHIDTEHRERDVAALAAVSDGANRGGVLFKMLNDPRVTRVGRVLRRYSLDELPQLFNILRGDMSIVGPRPPLPTEKYQRLTIQPGITGLWSIIGHGTITKEQSIQLEEFYAANWSVGRDFRILLDTALVALQPARAISVDPL